MTGRVVLFLSYARADRDRVGQLYDELCAEGFSPWMDARDLLPGEIWETRIRAAIRDADFFLACLSGRSIDKQGFVQAEMKEALRLWEEKPEGRIYVIPIRLEACPLPESLSRLHCADLFDPDGFSSLVRAIRDTNQKTTAAAQDVNEPPASSAALLGLSKTRPFLDFSVPLLDQYKLDDDFLPLLKQSLVERFGWNDHRVSSHVLFFIKEVSTNAFVHGGRGNPDATVTVHVAIENIFATSERIVIQVVSPGEGFDIARRLAEQESRSFEEGGGRGLVMAKRVADAFSYSTDGKIIQGVIRRHPQDPRASGPERVDVTCAMAGVDDILIAMLSIKGKIDHEAIGVFQDKLAAQIEQLFRGPRSNNTGIIVDLGDMPYISSAGLRILFRFYREVAQRLAERGWVELEPLFNPRPRTEGTPRRPVKAPVVFYRPTPVVRDIFDIGKFGAVVPVFGTLAECESHIREAFAARS